MDFKHFFKNTLTEKELRSNFKVINESRWWGKFKEDKTFTLEANGKTYKCCRMEEDGGPAYVLESRGGARYGLFRATEGHFHVIRMKSGKKHLIKPKGIFREVEGNLVFEMKDAIMNKEAAGIAMSPGSAAQQLEGTVTEDRMTTEPGKSFANGADTFDKWIKEIERGIYTDPK